MDGVYQRDDCFRGNRTNPFLFNDHLPNCTYRKIITRPISPGNKTASFSHMRHQRLPHPLIPFRRLTIIRCSPRGRGRRGSNQHDGSREKGERKEREEERDERVFPSRGARTNEPLEGTATRERTGATSGPLRTGNRNGRKPREGKREERNGEEQTDHSHPPFRGSRALRP